MTKTKRYAELKFNTEILPAEWSKFVNEYGFKWSKRSTPEFAQWKELRGKGYQIWISIPKPSRVDDKIYWEYAIDSTNHLPEAGIELLEDMMSSLKVNFPMTEINKTAANKT